MVPVNNFVTLRQRSAVARTCRRRPTFGCKKTSTLSLSVAVDCISVDSGLGISFYYDKKANLLHKVAVRLTALPNNYFMTHKGIGRETHGWRCPTSGRKSGRTVVFDRTYSPTPRLRVASAFVLSKTEEKRKTKSVSAFAIARAACAAIC